MSTVSISKDKHAEFTALCKQHGLIVSHVAAIGIAQAIEEIKATGNYQAYAKQVNREMHLSSDNQKQLMKLSEEHDCNIGELLDYSMQLLTRELENRRI